MISDEEAKELAEGFILEGVNDFEYLTVAENMDGEYTEDDMRKVHDLMYAADIEVTWND